jgi:dolichol-phosphate mannosyltransferase
MAPSPYSERPSADIAVVIPCYNVAAHVEAVIRAIPPIATTIVAVDDGSTDDTAAVLARLDDRRLKVIRHSTNRGVGAAVKTGYEEALRSGAGICVKLDGDGQMAPEGIAALARALVDEGVQYAKGNRFTDIGALQQMPPVRLLGNALLSFLVKLASGYWNVLDPTNGYTAIASAALRRITFAKLADRYFFETSMLVELNIARARIADVAMPARYGNERSAMNLPWVTLTFPDLLARSLLRRLYWRYLIEDFGVTSVCLLLGVPLVAFCVIFGPIKWAHSIRTGELASAGTVFVAGLPVILGFQLLLTAVVLDVLSTSTVKRNVPPD